MTRIIYLTSGRKMISQVGMLMLIMNVYPSGVVTDRKLLEKIKEELLQ